MAQPDPTLIDRRDYLRLSAGVAVGATAGLAGCSSSVPGMDDGTDGSGGDGSSATGLLSTAVSDQPGDIGDFESCIVTLDGIWVGPAVGSSEGSEDGDGENETEAESGDGNETDDGDGGPPDDAGTGQSSSDRDASGSQDDTSTTGNTTDQDGTADADETDEDADDADDGDDAGDDEDDEAEEGETEGDEEDGESDGNGRTYYEFEEPQEADLTQLQGEAQQLVGEHELSVGTYQFLQLDISGIRGTLTDGSEAEVDTPGNAPLKFNQSFEVREGYRTTFLADFTPVRRGNGSYLFQPVASETEVSYEQIDAGSGGGSNDGNTTDGGNTTTDGGSGGDDGGNTNDSDATTGGGNQTAS